MLGDPRDLRLAPLVTAWSRLEAPIAFAGARAQLLIAAICRAVPFLHQISLRDVVYFLMLVAHAMLLIQMLSKGLVVWYRSLAIQEQAAIMLWQFIFWVDGARTFV